MIEKVRLLNFISHGDTIISLRSGITVFVGRNGSGKSSVIDGITYALYGKHKRKSNENLVRRGSSSGSASVEFSTAGGKRFIAERKLNKRGQLEGSVLKEEIPDGTVRQLASGERKQFNESLSEEVAKVVGLDYERMRVAAIIQQGELDSIVNLSPRETKDLVNGLIGIDRLELAYDSAFKLIVSFRNLMRTKYGCDDTDVQRLRDKIEQEGSLVLSNEKLLASATAELDALRDDERALDASIGEMEPLRLKVELKRKEIEAFLDYIAQQKEEMERKHQELAGTVEKASFYMQVVGEEQSISHERELASDQQSAVDLQLQSLSSQIATLEVLKDRPAEMLRRIEKGRASLAAIAGEQTVKSRYESTESRLRALESEINAINQENGRYEGQLDVARKLEFKDNICPMCGTRVESVRELFDKDAIQRHLAKHRATLTGLTAEKRRLEPELKRLQTEMRAIEEAYAFMSENKITIDEGGGGGATTTTATTTMMMVEAIDRLEAGRKAMVEQLSKLPQLVTLRAKCLSEKTRTKARIEELGRKGSEIARGKGYLDDHSIASAEDITKLRQQIEELRSALRAFPAIIDDNLRQMEEIAPLQAMAFDEHSKKMYLKIEALSADAAKFDMEEYLSMSERLQALRSQSIPMKMAEIERCRTQLEHAQQEVRTANEALAIAERVSGYVRMLETIRSKVFHRDGPVSSSLRSWALEQIGTKASEYARLFGIGVSRIALREKARDVTIDCYGPRGTIAVDSLSGGEKVAIALALRFAMAYVMGGYMLDFVILDEPTVHLDEERKTSMVEIITSLGRAAGSPLKQVLIITHDEEIFDNAEVEAIYRFEASSEGTQVQLLN